MMNINNWIPVKLYSAEGNKLCKWIHLGDIKFTDPFFTETFSRCLRLPENTKPFGCVSDIEMINEWGKEIEYVPPTAFIFHVSRCGSTLVSQSLSLNEENIVLSEVPFFDELLRAAYAVKAIDSKQVNDAFRAAIKFYGQKRTGNEKHLFIKLDSWHLGFYEQLREMYPDTPFILLYRTPFEVILSQQKRRGMHAIPGVLEPGIFNLALEDIMETDFDNWTAKVLNFYFKQMLQVSEKDPLSLLVNYSEGIIPVINKIAEFTNTGINESMFKEIEARSKFHGKYPQELFHEDRPDIPPPDFLQKVTDLYHQLENKRLLSH